jgi:hypothetical protein
VWVPLSAGSPDAASGWTGAGVRNGEADRESGLHPAQSHRSVSGRIEAPWLGVSAFAHDQLVLVAAVARAFARASLPMCAVAEHRIEVTLSGLKKDLERLAVILAHEGCVAVAPRMSTKVPTWLMTRPNRSGRC